MLELRKLRDIAHREQATGISGQDHTFLFRSLRELSDEDIETFEKDYPVEEAELTPEQKADQKRRDAKIAAADKRRGKEDKVAKTEAAKSNRAARKPQKKTLKGKSALAAEFESPSNEN